ncbi:nitroreductase family protein [Bifidobacterium sp. ESL0690]|uniref:nitroreductase family protein n=1 Tax=Bifidobacterium sp. ESL0690 TaxID=2983214 RepID=UPI0023F8A421|nr:nitroreductase family protein [Bifidobacterium sp. ESL0690]WEV47073.1 nitroreductase family protein [Bifidobacterium sp. ESL0690]
MTVKNAFKSAMSPTLINKAKTLRYDLDVLRYGLGFYRRFVRNAAFPSNNGQSQLEARLIFNAHSLEKGLSHLDFRPGFGKKAVLNLTEIMNRWQKNGYPNEAFGYVEALAVLKAYQQKHESLNKPLPDFFVSSTTLFAEQIAAADSSRAGARREATQLHIGGNGSYADVITSRCSIRDYSDEPVNIDAVKRAGELALKAPSVCNRQPARLHIITNTALIHELLQVQGGMLGYADPPVLLLVISKMSTMLNPTELHEAYIDGGVYSMALLGALEAEDLGACPLNTMFGRKQESKIRDLLQLPDDDALIMFIAVGHKLKVDSHPVSRRKSLNEVISVHS